MLKKNINKDASCSLFPTLSLQEMDHKDSKAPGLEKSYVHTPGACKKFSWTCIFFLYVPDGACKKNSLK